MLPGGVLVVGFPLGLSKLGPDAFWRLPPPSSPQRLATTLLEQEKKRQKGAMGVGGSMVASVLQASYASAVDDIFASGGSAAPRLAPRSEAQMLMRGSYGVG